MFLSSVWLKFFIVVMKKAQMWYIITPNSIFTWFLHLNTCTRDKVQRLMCYVCIFPQWVWIFPLWSSVRFIGRMLSFDELKGITVVHVKPDFHVCLACCSRSWPKKEQNAAHTKFWQFSMFGRRLCYIVIYGKSLYSMLLLCCLV